MAIEQAWLLKGFALAHNAPPDVLAAAEAVIAELSRGVTMVTSSIELTIPKVLSPRAAEIDPPPLTEPKPKKKRRDWSPETRAAAAERMRSMQAKKKAEREGEKPEPSELPQFSEAERRITIPSPCRKSTLNDTDWPEIKQMMADGKSRKSIASDFDEDEGDLDYFIESCQRREGREGNVAAPSLGGA